MRRTFGNRFGKEGAHAQADMGDEQDVGDQPGKKGKQTEEDKQERAA